MHGWGEVEEPQNFYFSCQNLNLLSRSTGFRACGARVKDDSCIGCTERSNSDPLLVPLSDVTAVACTVGSQSLSDESSFSKSELFPSDSESELHVPYQPAPMGARNSTPSSSRYSPPGITMLSLQICLMMTEVGIASQSSCVFGSLNGGSLGPTEAGEIMATDSLCPVVNEPVGH